MGNSQRNLILVDGDFDYSTSQSGGGNKSELPSLVIDAEFREIRSSALASFLANVAYGALMGSGGIVIIWALHMVSQFLP